MLVIILNTAILTTIWIFIFIVLLLLNELGVFRTAHYKINENPKLMKILLVFGDALYGVGISVVGSVLFAASGINLWSYKLFLGIALIFLGAFIKR